MKFTHDHRCLIAKVLLISPLYMVTFFNIRKLQQMKRTTRFDCTDYRPNSFSTKIIATTSTTNIAQDKDLRHGKPSNSTTKNSTIGYNCNVLNELISQAISKALIYPSSEGNGFVEYLHIKDNHYELRK